MKGHAANEAAGSLCSLQLRGPVHNCPAYVLSTFTLSQPRCIAIALDVHPVCYLLQVPVLSRIIRAPDRLLYSTKSGGQQCCSRDDCVCPACCSQCCDLMFGIVRRGASCLLLLITAYSSSMVLPACTRCSRVLHSRQCFHFQVGNNKFYGHNCIYSKIIWVTLQHLHLRVNVTSLLLGLS